MSNSDELRSWMEQWSKAQHTPAFQDRPVTLPTYGGKEADAAYWDRLRNPHLLKEGHPLVPTEIPDGKSVADITDDLGKLKNSVDPSSRGVDNRNKVTPNWAGGCKEIELTNMMRALHKLGDELAKDPMDADEDTAQIQAKFDKLKQQALDLATSLNPDFVSDYSS